MQGTHVRVPFFYGVYSSEVLGTPNVAPRVTLVAQESFIPISDKCSLKKSDRVEVLCEASTQSSG